MHNRTTLALAVAGLALLAGCGAAPASDAAPYGQSTTMSDVFDGNQQTLQSSTSFQYNVSTVIAGQGGPGQQVAQNVSTQVNLETGELYVRQRLGTRGEIEGYATGNGSAYRRVTSQGQTQVQQVDASAVNTTGYTRPSLNGLLAGLDYSYRGPVEQDGQTRYNYTATGDSLNLSQPQNVGPFTSENVTAVESRLLVTDEGVIDSLTVDIVGSDGQNTYRYHIALGYDEVGSTTITEPEWAAQARTQSSG